MSPQSPLQGRPDLVPTSSPSTGGAGRDSAAPSSSTSAASGHRGAPNSPETTSSTSSRPRPDLVPDEVRRPLTTSSPRPLPIGTRTRSRSTAGQDGEATSSRGTRSHQQKILAALRVERAAGKATSKPCPSGCGATVLLGRLDATQAEVPYCIDPAPISSLGEAMARLTGRTTYDHRRGAQQIDERDDYTIKGSPADTPNGYRTRCDVVAEHRCGTPPLPTIPSRLT